MSDGTRSFMPRWLEAMLGLLGGAAALIAIVQFGVQLASRKSQPAAAPAATVQAAPAGKALDVVAASLRTAHRRSHILGLIPSGADHFLTLDVALANHGGKPRTTCTLLLDYTQQGGTRGAAVAFVGAWSDWYDGGAKANFDLSADPGTAQRFFTAPTSQPLRLAAARVRARCEGPDNQVSGWTKVDLSHAEWPKA